MTDTIRDAIAAELKTGATFRLAIVRNVAQALGVTEDEVRADYQQMSDESVIESIAVDGYTRQRIDWSKSAALNKSVMLIDILAGDH